MGGAQRPERKDRQFSRYEHLTEGAAAHAPAGRGRGLPCACTHRAPDRLPRIAALYDRLSRVMPSPVVKLNRAVAHSMAFGPEPGLSLLDALDGAAALQNYAPLPAVRGDFLFRYGRLAEARVQFEAASRLTRNAPEADFLRRLAAACG